MVNDGEILYKVPEIGISLSKKFTGQILTPWFPSFCSAASVKTHMNFKCCMASIDQENTVRMGCGSQGLTTQ